jgi:hypothetical protein
MPRRHWMLIQAGTGPQTERGRELTITSRHHLTWDCHRQYKPDSWSVEVIIGLDLLASTRKMNSLLGNAERRTVASGIFVRLCYRSFKFIHFKYKTSYTERCWSVQSVWADRNFMLTPCGYKVARSVNVKIVAGLSSPGLLALQSRGEALIINSKYSSKDG